MDLGDQVIFIQKALLQLFFIQINQHTSNLWSVLLVDFDYEWIDHFSHDISFLFLFHSTVATPSFQKKRDCRDHLRILCHLLHLLVLRALMLPLDSLLLLSILPLSLEIVVSSLALSLVVTSWLVMSLVKVSLTSVIISWAIRLPELLVKYWISTGLHWKRLHEHSEKLSKLWIHAKLVHSRVWTKFLTWASSFLFLEILQFEILSSDVLALGELDISWFNHRDLKNHLIQRTFSDSFLSIFLRFELNKPEFH